MTADALRERLRADLKVAMRERNHNAVTALRTLIAAIDNAQAIPLAPGAKPADTANFGDGTNEVARLDLGADELARIVATEIADRENAELTYRALGQADAADAVVAEAEVLRRYA